MKGLRLRAYDWRVRGTSVVGYRGLGFRILLLGGSRVGKWATNGVKNEVCVCVCVSIYIYICIYVYICVYIYMYIYMFRV